MTDPTDRARAEAEREYPHSGMGAPCRPGDCWCVPERSMPRYGYAQGYAAALAWAAEQDGDLRAEVWRTPPGALRDAVEAATADLRAEVERLRGARDAAQEHVAYHLRDYRLHGDEATGDLAVDMSAYAGRLKIRAEAAERQVADLRAGIEALAETKPGATGRALRALLAGSGEQPAEPPVVPDERPRCDGCNVREPFEHRCLFRDGVPCGCAECAEERRIFDRPAPAVPDDGWGDWINADADEIQATVPSSNPVVPAPGEYHKGGDSALVVPDSRPRCPGCGDSRCPRPSMECDREYPAGLRGES